jgi:hypothetical protein
MRALPEWLSGTSLSVAIQTTFWFIRLLQATHLVTAGVACVSGIMIALRALEWHRADQPFAAVWRRYAPWLGWSLTLMVVTGLAQTLGDPVREFTATSYWVKLALVLICIAGTSTLARTLRASPTAALRPSAKLFAAALIVFWLAIVMLGRMIGYDLAIWGDLSLRT